jgi:hypothetical protein
MSRFLMFGLLVGCTEAPGEDPLLHQLPGFSTAPETRVFRDGTHLDLLLVRNEVVLHHNQGAFTPAGVATLNGLSIQFLGRQGGSFGACAITDGSDLAITLGTGEALYTIAFCPFQAGDFQPLEDFAFDVMTALQTCTASELVSIASCSLVTD